VYGIIASLFVCYASFALVPALQLGGCLVLHIKAEYAYLALSVAAKTLLAWQMFAGTLA
jgi:hypothetical protein